MLSKFVIALVAFVALFVALPDNGPSLRPEAAQAYPGADNFQIVGQDCLSGTNVRLQMAWTSYGFGPQWFDVSLFNNGWVWGTFVGAGPIASGQSTFTWDGFVPNARHYLRVNTLTQFGWYESQTVTFVTRTCFGGGGGGGGGGARVGPHCDGVAWCAGDGIPTMCAQQGLYAGCVWVNRIYTNPYSYNPGEPIAICYWLPAPAYVVIQTQRLNTGGITPNLSAADDGAGDCLQGTVGAFGDRRTTLQLNGSPSAVDQVLWRVN